MKPNPSASRALAAVTAAAVVLVLATPILAQRDSAVPSKPDVRTITHVLNRIGFGARPGDVERVRALGLAKYIDNQLHPDRIPNDRHAAYRRGALSRRARRYRTSECRCQDKDSAEPY